MVIASEWLNKVVKRIQVVDDAITSFPADIAIRFANNNSFKVNSFEQSHFNKVSKCIGFINVSTEIEIGDYIFDQESYKEYLIIYIKNYDEREDAHHKVLYLTNTNDIAGKTVNISVDSLETDSFEVEWETFVETKRAVRYGTDKDDEENWTTTEFTELYELIGSVPVPDLEDNTTYYYRVISETYSGIYIESRVQTITTDEEVCPDDFGFTVVCPCLFKINDSTYVRYIWTTSYKMAEKKVMRKQVGAAQWVTDGPEDTSGTNHTIDGTHPIARGIYEFAVHNENLCDVWDNSKTYTFEITDGYPPLYNFTIDFISPLGEE